jgi:hypothetical protein
MDKAKKTKVLFIHGFMMNGDMMRKSTKKIQKVYESVFPNCEFIVPDGPLKLDETNRGWVHFNPKNHYDFMPAMRKEDVEFYHFREAYEFIQ